MKQQAGKQASKHSRCLQVKQQAGKQANTVDANTILMMLHQQTLTHHPTPKSERRMNQLAGTN